MIENKYNDVRNKYITKIENKINDLINSISLLHQVDRKIYINPLMNMTGGSVSFGNEPRTRSSGTLMELGAAIASIPAFLSNDVNKLLSEAKLSSDGIKKELIDLKTSIKLYTDKINSIKIENIGAIAMKTLTDYTVFPMHTKHFDKITELVTDFSKEARANIDDAYEKFNEGVFYLYNNSNIDDENFKNLYENYYNKITILLFKSVLINLLYLISKESITSGNMSADNKTLFENKIVLMNEDIIKSYDAVVDDDDKKDKENMDKQFKFTRYENDTIINLTENGLLYFESKKGHHVSAGYEVSTEDENKDTRHISDGAELIHLLD